MLTGKCFKVFALCRGAFYNYSLPLDWFSLLYSINFMVVQVCGLDSLILLSR